MLRQGKTDPGFVEMRAAASVDLSFAAPLVATARQFYGEDATARRAAVGDSPAVLAALSKSLADDKRFDDALETWRQIPNEESLKAADTGRAILGQMIAEKRFMAAMQLANLLLNAPKFSPGKVDDGGFENGIAASGATVFEWTLGAGTQPQIALTDGQKHLGAYSLLAIFRATANKEFRSLSQTVAVERGGRSAFLGILSLRHQDRCEIVLAGIIRMRRKGARGDTARSKYKRLDGAQFRRSGAG